MENVDVFARIISMLHTQPVLTLLYGSEVSHLAL